MINVDGYYGRFLRIELTEGRIQDESLTEDFMKKYVGGNGFGAAILYNETPAGLDPLGKDNKIVIASGLLNGTMMTSSPKIGFFSKSPLTGGFMDSYVGGHFSAELRFSGYDGMIIEGISNKPVYLELCDGKLNIHDAGHIWGMGTYEATRKIKEELGDEQYKVAIIGPAGENLVRYASIMVDNFHAAGRGGLGAVMGSKNIKAIAIKGTSFSVSVEDKQLYKEVADKLYDLVTQNEALMSSNQRYGTAGATTTNQATGILGTRNWQKEIFDRADKIDGDAFADNVFDRNLACFNCALKCLHKSSIKEGEYKGIESVGPQYEIIYSLGSLCENDNPGLILKANNLCNDLGVDSISAVVTIAFALECYEKGLLHFDDFNMDTEPLFGNGEAIVELIRKISYREGIGDLLAEGSKIAAKKIGKDSDSFAINVKGLELAGHSARGYKGMTLGYAVSNRGGSHMDMRHVVERSGQYDRRDTKDKPALVRDIQTGTVMRDVLGYCTFIEPAIGRVGITSMMVSLVNSVTGYNMDHNDLQIIADRIWNLERSFNIREGFSRIDDTLPKRFLVEPIPEGPSEGMKTNPEELKELLDGYYEIRGWDLETGIPLKSTLRNLGLEFVIADLYS